MELRFSKMHGLGNDFVVVDAIRQQVSIEPDLVRHIADRHCGIGCDQVLLVEPARQSGADFRYRIFNADGLEVEQCGNGARCFARFVREHGLTDKERIVVETNTGIITLTVIADDRISVDMGAPWLQPPAIPFVADQAAASYSIRIGQEIYRIGAVSMGNPHAVLQVDDVDAAPLSRLGPMLQDHPCFPQRVNAGFMQVLARDKIRLRVFERGVGETMACGSGACAAVVVGRLQNLLDPQVQVELRGGELQIAWYGGEQDLSGDVKESVVMTGPATRVFEGVITL